VMDGGYEGAGTALVATTAVIVAICVTRNYALVVSRSLLHASKCYFLLAVVSRSE
jgi:hypothetical protein